MRSGPAPPGSCSRAPAAEEVAALLVEVGNDGVGIRPTLPAGVGLLSLRQRAAELGGRSERECRPSGGTVVRTAAAERHVTDPDGAQRRTALYASCTRRTARRRSSPRARPASAASAAVGGSPHGQVGRAPSTDFRSGHNISQ